MRIAMCNWTSRRAGGAEQYLHRVVPALAAAGHDVVLACEGHAPAERAAIAADTIPADPEVLRAWRPDVIVNHGLNDPAREGALLAVAPAVLVGHSYYGTCISGSKTFTWPRVQPCDRTLGWGCLLRYYPRRTGGLNPGTLAMLWRHQRARQRLFDRYRAVAVFSDHMQHEFTRHGCTDVVVLPFPVHPAIEDAPRTHHEARLLFLGRCDPLKGGDRLIAAIDMLDSPVTATIAGDGPARAAWEASSRRLGGRVRFAGWLDDPDAAYAQADLLIVPSLWPEPFGQVGLEAARHGVPSVAFPIGGIPTWLRHGQNGVLARTPADAASLAEAISSALAPAAHRSLSAGALAALPRHAMDAHVSALTGLLERTA